MHLAAANTMAEEKIELAASRSPPLVAIIKIGPPELKLDLVQD
jgi:hypothetical protein